MQHPANIEVLHADGALNCDVFGSFNASFQLRAKRIAIGRSVAQHQIYSNQGMEFGCKKWKEDFNYFFFIAE